MPKTLFNYESEFVRDVLKEKYGIGNVTPEIYQKEVLKFMKKMDGATLLKDSIKFLNDTALDVVQTPSFYNDGNLAEDKNLYPIDFLKGLVVNASIPSNKIKQVIASKVNAAEFNDFCQEFINEEPTKSKTADIENKMNKFKVIEACKPTASNGFSRFFKKLFNIGGYNDKMAAYENAKSSLRELVGDKLTDEEFEHHIQAEERFKSTSLHSDLSNDKKQLNISESLIEKEQVVEVEKKPYKELSKEEFKEVENNVLQDDELEI